MYLKVLGPVRMWRAGVEVEVGPPKRRSVLALLLVRANRAVPVYEMVEMLWQGAPPLSAVNVVQQHVGALRRLLEPGVTKGSEATCLVRTAGGYRLELPPSAVDLLRFRELCAGAHALARGGALAAAGELLGQALPLWEGPVASGLPPHLRTRSVFAAVEREYVAAVRDAATWGAAKPAVGARMVGTLRQAAARHVLDEDVHAALMRLLAATGRQAEALEVHARLRTRLREERGAEPGEDLRRAHDQVLRQTVAREEKPLGHDRPGAADGAPPAVAPASPYELHAAAQGGAQLPADLADFVGRRRTVARLHTALTSARLPSARVVVLHGGAGVGKTALAVHGAHRAAGEFPDGQLYVDLGASRSGGVVDPHRALRSVLEAWGLAPHEVPEPMVARAALYHGLLSGRRVLVVLDDVLDEEQVRPLLPPDHGCAAIVTSRGSLPGLTVDGTAQPLEVDVLREHEAREFLVRRLGAERIAREAAAVADIIARCGRLPLALSVVSARALTHPLATLSEISDELRDSGRTRAATAEEGTCGAIARL